jgi:Arc/MetJ-type ribon-helix-helix transcriptional regulator
MTVTLKPEQEAILGRVVREGRFASEQEALEAAVNSLDPEATLPEEEKARRAVIRSKSLFELMQDSPMVGLNIEFERDRTPMRDINF